ncbi:tellurite resistance TerB family protein [Pseudooceanicola spongiae]|uniref:TerB family tellurite resistance protein n=1 Tax=Pseudooceanicola spongiae TaxID=2613965 RepID=A0A7L9WM11_9RHOB|nr:TerB family tellurite resistance protein [Pseudooceanicola spongiae]QOL80874.1 TerB family tellurite resistance protein [Pseudooceanicola spongiae]
MFADFLNRLIAPQPDPLNDGDARLALSALMVRVARSDGVYDKAERSMIARLLSQRYALSTQECEALLQDAETLETQAPDTVRFTRAIKDAVPYENRLSVVESLWKVVLVDGEREAEEDAVLRLVSNLLGISDPESARARQAAQSDAG